MWAQVLGIPQGISYHVVMREVDAGPLLLQHTAVPQEVCGSMIAFYAYVYENFPQHMTKAVENLLQQVFMPNTDSVTMAPNTLPCAKTFVGFRKKNGVVIRFRDVWLAVRLLGDI